jgi:hypothetical protein
MLQKFTIRTAVFFGLFLAAFWLTDGWYRVDCAIGIKKACEHVEGLYKTASDTASATN